jgi:hypothetical protein
MVNAVIVFNRPGPPPADLLEAGEQACTWAEYNLRAAQLAVQVLWHSGTLLLEVPGDSHLLLGHQLATLLAGLGEREGLDVNNGVLGCELGLGDDHPARARLYKQWCEGRRLPFPGSLAQLRQGGEVLYPQFI